jgi:hypothetical protein
MLSSGVVPPRAPLDEAECGGFEPDVKWETKFEV